MDYRLHASETGSTPTTVIEARYELKFVRRLQGIIARAFGWEIRRQMTQEIKHLKAFAQSEDGTPPVPPTRRGLWQRPQNTYEGLVEACSPGVHEAAANMLLADVKPGGAVLDLGAGTGAWLARLRAAGFSDLAAVELNAEGFGLAGITPRALDLNEPFSDLFDKRFQLVTAIEIVEHLDNPRHVLREVHRLLADDGHALLTMPNVGHWAGRVRFFLRGEHLFFEEPEYEQRHISPVTDLHMHLMFSEIGFRVINVARAGNLDGRLKRIFTAPVAFVFRVLLGPATQGDVNIYLVARDKSDDSSFGRDANYNRRVAAVLRDSGIETRPPRES
jgi:SAM-dependent methyltransferase